MISERKLLANQCNGRRSTGPRTSAGKAVSCRNAIKGGFFARDVVLAGESRKEFEWFSQAIVADLQPTGPLEESLVDIVVACLWRLRRILRIESGLFKMYRVYKGEDGGVACAFAHDASQLDCLGRLTRYEAHIERRLDRTLRQIQELQGSRTPNTGIIEVKTVASAELPTTAGNARSWLRPGGS